MIEGFCLESQTSATRQIHFSHIKKTLFKWHYILTEKKTVTFQKVFEVITKLAQLQCLVLDPVINIANFLLTFKNKKNSGSAVFGFEHEP